MSEAGRGAGETPPSPSPSPSASTVREWEDANVQRGCGMVPSHLLHIFVAGRHTIIWKNPFDHAAGSMEPAWAPRRAAPTHPSMDASAATDQARLPGPGAEVPPRPEGAAAEAKTAATDIASAEAAGRSISDRLENDILVMPPPSRSSELNGVDNLYYPEFLEGEWAVTQTLVNASTPLGLKFVGGPSGSADIATASMADVRKKLNVPVSLRLRYVRTKWGVAEDRLFNARQRLDAFAGRSVVSSVEYADVGGSNRRSVLALGGTEDDPLQTTVVRFRGPAAQKTFVVAHGSEPAGAGGGYGGWAGFELDRSIFALTNQNTAPPVTTDTELVWSFERGGGNRVIGRLRIASYLNAQSDALYFEAKNRAVSLQDYDLDMVKL